MSFTEIIVIMAIALILFGPEELPEIARKIGKVVFEIRKATNELTKEFQTSMDSPVKVMNSAFEQVTTVHVAKQETASSPKGSDDHPDHEELLTYEDENSGDPLAQLPLDMVSYEEKGASR